MKFAHALAIKPVSTELDNLFFLEVGQLNEQKSAEPHRGVSLVAIRLGGSGVPWARQFIARMILHAVHIDVGSNCRPYGTPEIHARTCYRTAVPTGHTALFVLKLLVNFSFVIITFDHETWRVRHLNTVR